MNTKILSDKALSVIDQYQHFHLAKKGQSAAQTSSQTVTATCSIPYFNNQRSGMRAGLRALGGKGSPRDIFDEAEIIALREKVSPEHLTNETLKKFLVDHNLGIDCSGLAYYVLNAESVARGDGSIDRHLHFPLAKGLLGKIRSKLRPAENTNVLTLAHNANSHVIDIAQIQPGDFISMIKSNDPDPLARDHMIIIHQVEYQNFIPTTLHYTQAMAWPTDGSYGHGIRQGEIIILDPKKSLLEQRWTETGKTGDDNYTFIRAKKSLTEIRRLNWFK